VNPAVSPARQRRRRGSRRRRGRDGRRGVALVLGGLVAGLAQRVPERWALRVGAAVGRAAWWLFPRRRRLARANLRIAFPAWSDERREGVARASFEELGRSLVEWSRLPALGPEELRSRVELVGVEHADRALAAGRGAFFATAHYGNWELLPAAWRAWRPDRELVVVGRTFEDAGLQRRVERRRILGGGALLRRDARAILRALRGGAAVGVLVDLYTSERRGGMLIPFFGVRAWTNVGPATLALRTGAPIVPVTIRRVEGGRHRVIFRPALAPVPRGDRGRDTAALATAMLEALESTIRADPVPWLWIHRRWKHSPDL